MVGSSEIFAMENIPRHWELWLVEDTHVGGCDPDPGDFFVKGMESVAEKKTTLFEWIILMDRATCKRFFLASIQRQV